MTRLAVAALLAFAAAAHADTGFVDESTCASCHATAAAAWAGSHHDLAMQEASASTVRGAFHGSEVTYAGVTSRFSQRDGRFFVRTDGADGQLAEFAISAAFGVEPLQQYLVDFADGRKQPLPLAWDTAARRWFHLYPDESVDFRDELHWTKPAQNWNHMCGECHATGYRKNYDAGKDRFATAAARFDVGCQACHGPAARHLEWAKSVTPDAAPRPRDVVRRGFDVDLSDGDRQLEVCAQCHARRARLSDDVRFDAPLLDAHLPALLTEDLYTADGQILGEVFEYGSFLQSRMHAKGVRCSDCHEPHSTRVRAPGNALCVTCHNPTAPAAGAHVDTSGLLRKTYDAPEHHFHQPGTPGARCVDCHAPPRTYMVVDPRHDHSFRVPRPDLSVSLGTPNACQGCHADKPAPWAVEQIERRFGTQRRQQPHFGSTLAAGRRGQPGAAAALAGLIADTSQPGIVRATALEVFTAYPGRPLLEALARATRDGDALVRRTAATAHESLPPEMRRAALEPLLSDPTRAVRIEAARLLAPVAAGLAPDAAAKQARAIAELEAVFARNADRADGLTNQGNLAVARNDAAAAERLFEQAIRRDPHFVPAYVNLADLYRATGREPQAESTLRAGLAVVPQAPALHETLGLALVRQGRKNEALQEFTAAVNAAPEESRLAYVYALSLDDAGRRAEAIAVLETADARRSDRDILLALAAYARDAGDTAAMARHLQSLAAINPHDPAVAPAAPR